MLGVLNSWSWNLLWHETFHRVKCNFLSLLRNVSLVRYASVVRSCRRVSYLSFLLIFVVTTSHSILLLSSPQGVVEPAPLTAFAFENLSGTLGFDCVSGDNIRPADQSPMLLNTSTESDLFTDSRAGRICEGQFCGIGLDAHNLRTRCR